MKKLFLAMADKIPFLGTRFWCAGTKAHKMALREFLFVVIFSTIPIWLSAVLLTGIDPEFQTTNLIKGGELFLYCTVTLAAIAWLNIKISLDTEDNDAPKSDSDESSESSEDIHTLERKKSAYPPDKYWFWFLVILGLIISVSFYALNLAKVVIDSDYMMYISIWIYIACLFLYHNILVSQHSTDYYKPLQEVSSENTEEFVEGYADHRGQQ